MRKLCALSQHNPTRKAVFEFDKLVRSLYTLNYLRDAQMQRDVHRSQNRLEAYHQLRSVIAQVGGRKQLAGRTDLDMAISNQCARLIANVVIAYNSVLLSKLLERYQAADDQKAILLLQKISPVAWQHIHLLGRYMFRDRGHPMTSMSSSQTSRSPKLLISHDSGNSGGLSPEPHIGVEQIPHNSITRPVSRERSLIMVIVSSSSFGPARR